MKKMIGILIGSGLVTGSVMVLMKKFDSNKEAKIPYASEGQERYWKSRNPMFKYRMPDGEVSDIAMKIPKSKYTARKR